MVWLPSWQKSSSRGAARRQWYRPGLEVLEDRVVPTGTTNALTIQPLGYTFDSSSNEIVGRFLVYNNGPALTSPFTLGFSALPAGVTESGSVALTSLAAGHWAVMEADFTPDSAPFLDLLGKAKDPAGNVLYPTELVDQTYPTITSISITDPSPTSATTLHFTVTFSQDVKNVTAKDFTVVDSDGISFTSLIVTQGADASTYTVTVNGVSGITDSSIGTLGLNLSSAGNIESEVDLPLATPTAGQGTPVQTGGFPFVGPTYTLEIAPAVVSTASTPNPTNLTTNPAVFVVTFSQAVNGVVAANFTTTGIAGVTVGTPTPVGAGPTTTWDVPVTIPANSNGDVTLDVNNTGMTIVNAFGLQMFTSFDTGTPLVVDTTDPTLDGITLVDATPTTATTLQFTVTFSEAVQNVAANKADFALVATGNVTDSGFTIAPASGSATTYTVTVTGVAGSGELSLKMNSGTGITDLAGNSLSTTNLPVTSPTYAVNPPAVNITPVLEQANHEGDVISLQVTASDTLSNPFTYSATGLPGGLSISPSTGLITGTIQTGASASSPHTVIVTATDSVTGVSGVNTFTWLVYNASDPLLKPPATQLNINGDSVSGVAVTATGSNSDPITYTATNLPPGLSIGTSSGIISGTISANDSNNSPYTVTVTATQDSNTSTATFTWVVTPSSSSSLPFSLTSPAWVTLPSGMRYQDLTLGTGAVAAAGDNITVNYVGYLVTGTQFGSQTGFSTPLNASVITGWVDGIPGMKVGGTRLLDIPASLAYGSTGKGSIPPNAELVFSITLTAVS